MNNPNWYAIYTRPAQEDWAAFNLRNQAIETLVPRYQTFVSNGFGKRRTVIKPLFPRYIFACFDVESRIRSVRSTRGVSSIVTFNDLPAIVEQAVIDEISSRIIDGFVQMDEARSIECPFKRGETVKIVDGPMYGLTGIFQSYISEKQRVDILMTMFGRQTSIRFGIDEIEPLSYALA